MNPEAVAVICLNNNRYRFDAVVKWINHFPNHWQLNYRVFWKRSRTRNQVHTTCLLLASEYSDAHFVSELLRLGASTEVLDSNLDSPLHKAITSKLDPVTKTSILIANRPSLVRSRNKSGSTPLHYAIIVDNTEITKLLLEQGLTEVNARTSKLLTPLHVATHFGKTHIVSILLQSFQVNVNAQDYKGDTATHHAACYGHLQSYTLLRMHIGYNPMVRNQRGFTTEEELFNRLLDVCLHRPIERVIELVEQWRVPLHISGFGSTALHHSCRSAVDGLKKVRFLIEKQSSLISHRLPVCASQAVHVAAQNKNKDVLAEIISNFETEINSKTSSQTTALHITCLHGYIEHTELLLKKALIDVNIADKTGNTPLHIACSNGRLEIIHALKSHPTCTVNIRNKHNKCPDELTPYHIRVLELAKTGFYHELQCVVRGPCRLVPDREGNTPVHVLSFSSSIVESDIAKKADLLITTDPSQLERFNNSGLLPIHLAVKMASIPLLLFLLQRYGHTKKTRDQWNLLHVAARYDRASIARLLLTDNDFAVNELDLDGNTPGHVAASWYHLDTLRVIQSHTNFNPCALNNAGKTVDEVNPINMALWQFCKRGTSSSVSSILEQGATSLFDIQGNSVLYTAYTSDTDRIEKCLALIKHQPMLINHKNKVGETLLHKATIDGDEMFAEFLLNQEVIEKNAVDIAHMTPMHRALEHSYILLVKTFLRFKADVNVCNDLGRSCVHTSVEYNQIDIMKELLAVQDVQINEKDTFGRSPFQLAIDYERHSLIWILASHPRFRPRDHDPETSQVLLNHGELNDLLHKEWHAVDSVLCHSMFWSGSLDLVHGHICHSGEHGVTVYDLELREAVTYSTKLSEGDSEATAGDIGWCHQVAPLDNGELVVAAENGLFLFKHTGIKSEVWRGHFSSVQSHDGHVYAALRDNDQGGSYVHVFSPPAWPWQLIHGFRLPCADAHLISLGVNTAHIHACCPIDNIIYTLTHEGVLTGTHGRKGEGGAGDIREPLLCRCEADGTLLVADRHNKRLQLLQLGTHWSLTGVALSQRARPERAVYTPGRLYVLSWDIVNNRNTVHLYKQVEDN